MEDKLRLNTKLFGFDGIIGRRDYFLNCMYIVMIAMFTATPLTVYLIANITSLENFFNTSKIVTKAPIFLQALFIIGQLVICTLVLSNVTRRLNDIRGKIDINLRVFFYIIFILNSFYIYFNFGLIFIISTIATIMGIYLLFAKGKITSKYPHDFTKIFNWGAFFGTWVWGLVNKSYITLLQLILGLTPLGFYFAIICGLKGNEWAYKNKKWNDIEKFNRNQETQTMIFGILSIVFIFAFYIIQFGTMFLLGVSMASQESSNAKTETQVKQSKTTDFFEKMTRLYFKKYEITEKENRFYMSKSDWNSYLLNDKMDIFRFASGFAAHKKSLEFDKKEKLKELEAQKEGRFYIPKLSPYTKTSEMTNTKIYCLETNKLLAEFDYDFNNLEKKDKSFLEEVAEISKGFKFYKAE